MRGASGVAASHRRQLLSVYAGLLITAGLGAVAFAAEHTAPAAELPRQLPLAGWSSGVADLRLLELSGEDITNQLEPQERAGKISLLVSGARPFIAKPKQLQTLVLADSERTVLPGGFVMTLPAANSAAPNAEAQRLAWFRITVIASPLPAPWSEATQSYGTALSFGLKAPANSPAGLEPPGGVVIRFAFENATAEELLPITLEQPGVEHEKTVALRFRPTAASPQLVVRSTISDVNLELRAQPRLEVRPVQAEVLGLGLAPVEVNVLLVSPDGAGLPARETTPLLLQVSRAAKLEPSTPTFGPGESRTVFSLRSGGVGAVRIEARAGSYVGSATVQQRFPIAPLAAALLGGALGGFARRFVKGARRAAAWRRVIEGLVVSCIAFVAGVLGVNYFEALPAGVVTTEAGGFLTGALSGFVGVLVLEGLSASKLPNRRKAASGAA